MSEYWCEITILLISMTIVTLVWLACFMNANNNAKAIEAFIDEIVKRLKQGE
jgi:hypothetical protein